MTFNARSGANSRYVRSGQEHDDEFARAKNLLFFGLEDVVAAIPRPVIACHITNSKLIASFRALTSYSRLDSAQPRILVPGAPPVWIQPKLPLTLSKDIAERCEYQRLPKYSLVPLVSAICSEQATGSDTLNGFKLSTMDAVSDRNALRKLLRWIRGGTDVRDFRIDVQLARSTVLFTRREPQDEEDVCGCGKAFEKATTRHNPDETGHHRIITYTLAGVKLLVRYELDACLPEAVPCVPAVGQANVDTLTTTPDSTKISVSTLNGSNSLITVAKGGRLVPQSSTMELKTRSRTTYDKTRHTRVTNAFDWTEAYFQLVLSQTPHLALGWHDRGTVNTIERKTLHELEQGHIGRAHRSHLHKLGEILRLICNLVKERSEGELLSLVCENGTLTLRRHTDRPEGALPAEMLQLFETS